LWANEVKHKLLCKHAMVDICFRSQPTFVIILFQNS
jgi:hypothetical protein